MLTSRFRQFVIGLSSCTLLLAAHELQAQWGTNAPACNNKPCVPARGSWGHYQTSWRRWPGAVYPDMIQQPSGGVEGIPPTSVDLPDPSKEADVYVPSPTRQPLTRPGPSGFPEGNEPMPGLLPGDPRGDGAAPGAGPGGGSGINELPPTLPADDLPSGPMGSNLPPQGSAPRGSGSLPRLKLRTSGADNVAGRDESAIHGPRLTASEHDEVPAFTSARLRRVNSAPQQQAASPGEPELLAPSPTTKPLEGANGAAEPRTSSANPLRTGVVHTAVFEEESPQAIEEGGPSPASGPVRVNPLRR